MNIENFSSNATILHGLCKYPLFLLNKDLEILASPASFIKLPKLFFDNYKQQVHGMLQDKQRFYMLYEHGYFYIFIPLPDQHQFVWIGPVLLQELKKMEDRQRNPFLIKLESDPSVVYTIKMIPLLQENIVYVMQLVFQNVLHQDISIEQLSIAFRQDMDAHIQTGLLDMMSRKRELDTRDYSYADEVKLLYHIEQGDTVSARIMASKLTKGRLGQLSAIGKTPLYAFITLVSLVAHTAMNSGVEVESAFGLNDVYIRKAEAYKDASQLHQLSMDMVVDFCLLIQRTTKYPYPTWVQQCIGFIMRNLHQVITLDMIALEVHMLGSYVSVQFKKITGVSLMNFIQEKRIDEAAFLLRNTNTSILEISTLLAFSSQTYFSTIFKKQKGISPKAYRAQPFQSIKNS